jgi:NAD(P)-dependent dehydrogenase (short-subunit alcohol dehydrogenase family)
MQEFTGKVAVVTGASSGLGRELSLAAAARGMHIVIADIDPAGLQAVEQELVHDGHIVKSMVCDVRQSNQMDALADMTEREFGSVHLLFNNAGVGTGGLVWESTTQDWDWVLGVNLMGVVHGIRAFVPRMLACAERQPGFRGHVVNTASIAGLLPGPLLGPYNVSKDAVISLSESLYHDLHLVDAPIGASVLCPFYMPTQIHRSSRVRPVDLQNSMDLTASQKLSNWLTEAAVSAGATTAKAAAEFTFQSIRDNLFYIFPDGSKLMEVRERMEGLLAHRNPTDPFHSDPRLGKLVKSKLKRRSS